MGGDSPLAATEPRVLYVSDAAGAIAAAWNDDTSPFELVPAVPAEAADVFAAESVDCVVRHAEGTGVVEGFLAAVREHSETVPIVVLATTDDVDTGTVLAHGGTYVDCGPNFDPIERLADVEPIVERHRETVRERTMLDSLIERIPVSVYWKDRKGRHVEVSDAMLSMIGPDYMENPEGKRFHAPGDVVGTSDWDLYPVELAAETTEDDRRVMETGEPIVDQIEHSYGNPYEGTYVATSKAPWYDEQGRVVGLVGITRDVSDRMQYEHQLERQNERLERFARVISHDLRNPLEVARGRLDLAREGEDTAEHFGAMDRALARMDALIDDVLTLAREGEVVADPEPVDLASAARDAWELVDAGDATLVVETDIEIFADPGRLQQVLENCFRNAVEHGTTSPEHARDAVEHGSPSPEHVQDAVEHGGRENLTVTVGTVPYHGFYVADDGRGIPEDVREEVFEPGVSAGDDGTGLGLGIVRTIAEAHGWRVDVTESDAGGARFEFLDVRRSNR